MAGAQAKANPGGAVANKTGDLAIKDFFPKELPIGAGQKDAIVIAEGLFEYDELGELVPKKDLVFGIMTNDELQIDNLILVEPINTTDIDDFRIRLKVTVPRHTSIQKGQCRNVVLKKKYEPLDENGQCDPHSDNCSVFAHAVALV